MSSGTRAATKELNWGMIIVWESGVVIAFLLQIVRGLPRAMTISVHTNLPVLFLRVAHMINMVFSHHHYSVDQSLGRHT